MSQNNDGNIQWKNIGIIAAGLIVLWLFFNQLNPGYSAAGWHGHMGSGFMGGYGSTGSNLESLLYGILILALKFLWVLLFIGLVLSIYHATKKYFAGAGGIGKFELNSLNNNLKKQEFSCPTCKENLKEEFKFCPNCKTSLKNICGECGKELSTDWKCCPCCGKEQEVLIRK